MLKILLRNKMTNLPPQSNTSEKCEACEALGSFGIIPLESHTCNKSSPTPVIDDHISQPTKLVELQKAEEWEDRLMDEFAVMFERAGSNNSDWVNKLESFIKSLLSQVKKEAYQEGYAEGEKMEVSMRGEVWEKGRQALLAEIEEKIKELENPYQEIEDCLHPDLADWAKFERGKWLGYGRAKEDFIKGLDTAIRIVKEL